MQRVFELFLSPMVFAIGFLWPLISQSVVALGWLPEGWAAIALGALVSIACGLIVQVRGSWIWLR